MVRKETSGDGPEAGISTPGLRAGEPIHRPDFLMIGATGRNVGKTEFACRVIQGLAPFVPVTALKITAISETGGLCPRGGAGCGVCTSLEGHFSITEEVDCSRSKDTSRMLQAGARRVQWLRVHRAHLREGIEALLAQVPVGTAVVCESNTARRAIRPGLFLMIRQEVGGPVKASARDLVSLADRVVDFHGDGWNLAPERCRFHRGAWALAHEATAVILAGGQSRRMGQDKSLLDVSGLPLIARIADQLQPRFCEVLVSANDSAKYRFLGLPIIPDPEPGLGPLAGILAGLRAARHDRILAVACDIPVLDPDFLDHLLELSEGADVVMPRSPDGRHEPMVAVYHRRVIPRIEAVLAEGRRRIVDILPGLAAVHPPMPEGWYFNLNTREDLGAFRQASLERQA